MGLAHGGHRHGLLEKDGETGIVIVAPFPNRTIGNQDAIEKGVIPKDGIRPLGIVLEDGDGISEGGTRTGLRAVEDR